MEEIYAKGKIPVLVGGTGFYIQAITKDIDFTQAEPGIRIPSGAGTACCRKGK